MYIFMASMMHSMQCRSIPAGIILCAQILTIVFIGCKKDDDKKPKATDTVANAHILLPVNDVTWRAHFQGTYFGDSTGYHYDTSYHSFATVTGTGNRKMVAGLDYYVYAAAVLVYHGGVLSTPELNGE